MRTPSDPQRLLVAGDVHGNAGWLDVLCRQAAQLGGEAVRADVDEDDERWSDAPPTWLVDARRVVGNPVNHLEIASIEVPAKLRSRTSLGREIARDGVVLIGQPLEAL